MKISSLILRALGTACAVLAAGSAVANPQSERLPPGRDIDPLQRDTDRVLFELQAQIDGRSQLVLDDHTAQWLHFDFAAPGQYFCSKRIVQPTLINGIAWYPEWPVGRDCERRSCNCSSGVFEGVVPAVPDRLMGATLELVDARGSCTIVEAPTRSNGFRVVVEFNDDDFEGAAWYDVELVLWFAQQDVFCHSKPNSTGMVADIEMTGSMSITRNDVELYSGQCPPGVWGQFFYGPRPASIPFGDGILCVSPLYPGLMRLPPIVRVDAAGGAEYDLDLSDAAFGTGFGAGEKWYFQYWYRDAKPDGAGYNLSDGLMALFTP
jgi:hypothetical protein